MASVSPAHLQVHALQHGHIQAAFGEALGQALGFQHHDWFLAILACSACWHKREQLHYS
jgi:hypothetical protein